MKTLVVYASKYGATKVGAERIAKELEGEVQLVNLKDKKEIAVQEYDKIIVGTPIYAGMVNKHIKDFCEMNEVILQTKKVAIFFSCMDSNNIEVYLKNNFKQELINRLVVADSCGGAFYFKKMNFLEKFIIKKIMQSSEKTKQQPMKIDTKVDIELFDEKRITNFIEAINRV